MNATNNRQNYTWVPLALAAALIVGVLLGSKFTVQKASDLDRKLNNILNLVASEYVDNVDMDSLVEMSIPQILANLDPHSIYFSAKDYQAAEDELNGSFSGVGISFQVMSDTINVTEVIPGGPSEKAGILTGDKIVTVNGKPFVGQLTPTMVKDSLRGPKGSVVKLGIKRNNSKKLLVFSVTRGDIPVKSVDAAYMIEKNTGYVKVNQFGRNTYDEFVTALSTLQQEGAKRYIIDLRGNGGGFMEMAIRMVNEFLPANELIVSTKGRYKRDDSQVWSDGNGAYQSAELVVLLDEFSASASEIFAGAIQDNDRGLVIGRRSFGKGLVQKEFPLPDQSAIRLTIARYYTPSGRCIQKDYKKAGLLGYDHDLIDRMQNGELANRDSMKIDKSQAFKTTHGRTVYGGGGIIPDVFVPADTTGITSYYVAVANAGLLQQFALDYSQHNKAQLGNIKDYKQLLRVLSDNDALISDFAAYASERGVPARWYYINQSKTLLSTNLKALIARELLGQDAFYPILNRTDKTIDAALRALDRHEASFPILPSGLH